MNPEKYGKNTEIFLVFIINHKNTINITYLLGFSGSLLTDVVVLTPSDEILPSAYPSCILNSATSTNQNLPSKFWKVTSVDLGAE